MPAACPLTGDLGNAGVAFDRATTATSSLTTRSNHPALAEFPDHPGIAEIACSGITRAAERDGSAIVSSGTLLTSHNLVTSALLRATDLTGTPRGVRKVPTADIWSDERRAR
jgi:hypothetical protein